MDVLYGENVFIVQREEVTMANSSSSSSSGNGSGGSVSKDNIVLSEWTSSMPTAEVEATKIIFTNTNCRQRTWLCWFVLFWTQEADQ